MHVLQCDFTHQHCICGLFVCSKAASTSISRESSLVVLYRLPADTQLTPLCKDLLRRIFHPSPEVRITILDIQKHPWFVQNLPAQMQTQDWNSHYIQHVDAKARADTIRQTVRAALDEPLIVNPAMQSGSKTSLNSNVETGVWHDRGHFEAHMYHGQV